MTLALQALIAHLVPLFGGRGGAHETVASLGTSITPVVAQNLPTEFNQEMLRGALEQFAGSAGFVVGGGIILAYFGIVEPIMNRLQDEAEKQETNKESTDGDSLSSRIPGVSTTPSAAAKTTSNSTTKSSAPVDAPSAMTSTATTDGGTKTTGGAASRRGSTATDGGVQSSGNELLEARRAASVSTTKTAKSTVVRTEDESDTPPLGRAETYELQRTSGRGLRLTVAPVLGTGTDGLSHDDDSVLETLGELVDDAERAGVSLLDADSDEYADDLAEKYGVWIHDVSRP